ncbi:hypothetical protein LJC20_06110 [Eubacteriales bacterium OttesenSCG-928-M02]|nr:hypothetical protein [Eubacteriales bacterium OttesenSCG-928-M02]
MDVKVMIWTILIGIVVAGILLQAIATRQKSNIGTRKKKLEIDWEREFNRVRDRVTEKLDLEREEEISADMEWMELDTEGQASEATFFVLEEGEGDMGVERLFPHTTEYHTYEPAYEEEGMGEHIAQGDDVRHGVRPAWQDTPMPAGKVQMERLGLRNAVIAAEVLGKPLSKRKKG